MAADFGAMILAAGLGTRLRPLTDELPKPVVPVLNRPLAAFSLEHLATLGVRSVTLNTHHLPAELESTLTPYASPGMALRFIHESKILGTGGGIRNGWLAAGRPDPFVVMNGDVLFAPSVARALELHRDHQAVATMVLREVAHPERYGAIEIDSSNQVVRLLGKPAGDTVLRKLMFTGVHVLSAAALESLPVEGCVVRQGYRHWIDDGLTVMGHVDQQPWLELGTPDDYAAAQFAWLREPPPWLADRIHDGSSLIAPTATLGAATTIRDSVVGAGASVADGVELNRVILWPGATVTSDLRDAIVTTAGKIVCLNR